MKTLLTLAALLSAGTFAPAQDLGKKLEYKTVAVPLHKALADLSAQAGVALYAGAGLDNEPVVLRLHDASVQDTMTRLAAAMSGEWRKAPDGYELWRSPDMAAKLAREAVRIRGIVLKKALDEKIKVSGADKAWGEEDAAKLIARMSLMEKTAISPTDPRSAYRARNELREGLPDQRALWRLIALLDVDALAAIPDGEKVVFSNEPTQMQRGINDLLDGFGEQFQREHNLYTQALMKAASQKKAEQGSKEEAEDEDDQPDPEMKVTPVRFVLLAERTQYGEGLSFRLLAFDADNHLLKSTGGRLASDPFTDMEADRAKMAKQVQNEPDIEVSPVTAELLKFIRSMVSQEGMAPPNFNPEVRQALLHPETLDPLATAASEALLGVAQFRNENLVFYPDDSMFMVSLFAGQEGKFKPSLVMQSITGVNDVVPYNITEEKGWLVLGPVDPLASAATRTNREAFGAYLRALVENGFAPLAETAQLAITVRGSEFPMLVMLYSMLVDPSTMGMMGQVDLRALKLYASLAPEQVRRLESQQALSFAELSREQLGLAYNYVYNSSIDVEGSKAPEDQRQMEQKEAATEPTEALPDGLPSNGSLTLTMDNTKTYFVKMAFDKFQFTMPMDVTGLTGMLEDSGMFASEGPDGIQGKTKVVSISPGMDRSLHLKLGVGEKKSVEALIRQTVRIPGGPWTKDTLPEDLKKEIAALKLKMQQAQIEEGDGDEGEEEPPSKTAPPSTR